MKKNYLLKSSLLALVVAIVFSVIGCSKDEAASNNGEIKGSITYTYTGKTTPFTTAVDTNWPGVAKFPGRMKISFVQCNASGVPTAPPVSGIPGLGAAPGIAYSVVTKNDSTASYTYSTSQSEAPKLDNNTYRVSAVYVNPYLSGQSSQQEIGYGIATVSGSTTTLNFKADMKIAYDSMLSAKSNTGSVTVKITATNPANWPKGTGAPNDFVNTYVALVGDNQYIPAGYVPDLYVPLYKPNRTTDVSDSTYVDNNYFGTYDKVNIVIYKNRAIATPPFFAVDSVTTIKTLSSITISASNKNVTLPDQTVTFP